MSARRYAIYFAPAPDSELWRFGSRVIGYDAATGEPTATQAPPEMTGAEWSAATSEARRYGFHATLKAPFRLAPHCDERDLVSCFDSFCAVAHAAPQVRLDVRAINSFIALTPEAESSALSELAKHAVLQFEPFRAPLTADEVARRLESPLTERQQAYLAKYGYPYVMDEFRFHMTLTSPLHFELRGRILAFLREQYDQMVAADLVFVDRVALFCQDSPADRFRIMRSATLC